MPKLLWCAKLLSIGAGLTAVVVALKLPLAPFVLPYHDDGETLYHVLALLGGLVPYRDDVSHHFLGYTLPLTALARLAGFGAYLIPLGYVLNQTLCGILLFSVLRFYLSRTLALAGALLLVTAREPFVLSFYPLYQLNLLMLAVWYFALRAVRSGRLRWLCLCAFTAGTSLVFDQRALFLLIIPAALPWLLPSPPWPRRSAALAYACCLPAPLLALAYLAAHGALRPFWEQTLVYPLLFRGASTSIFGTFDSLVELHSYLIVETPLLLLLAALGAATLLARPIFPPGEGRVAALFCLPVCAMPFLGGRGFDYYTIPYLALFAFLAPFTAALFAARSPLSRRVTYVLLYATPVLALAAAGKLLITQELIRTPPDAAPAVAAFLKAQPDRAPNRTYVWGYRPDIYVHLAEVAPLSFVNRQLIHPDAVITGNDERLRHIYPAYEERFYHELATRPPQYIVTYSEGAQLFSPSDSMLRTFVSANYEQVFSAQGSSFNGAPHEFAVFRQLAPGSGAQAG